jgi:hypothetical protein
VLRNRPGGEVDVRVGEPGEDAAAAEVDPLGPRERGLVRADAADDPLARDREAARERQRGLHRADDAVLEDHLGERNSSRPSPVVLGVNTLVILLLLLVIAALATFWPTSD